MDNKNEGYNSNANLDIQQQKESFQNSQKPHKTDSEYKFAYDVQPNTEQPKCYGLGITSMILGIFSVIPALLMQFSILINGYLFILSVSTGVVSFAFGWIALTKNKRNWFGLAGILSSAIGVMQGVKAFFLALVIGTFFFF